MIDQEYQKYIDEQPLSELKKIAVRINKMHFPDEFFAVVKKIEELEGDKFDREFYYSESSQNDLHLDVETPPEDPEALKEKSKRISNFFLYTFAVILSINVYYFAFAGNLLSVIPVIVYFVLIFLNISKNPVFGKLCKIWAVGVVIISLLLNFKGFFGIVNQEVLSILNSLIGSGEILKPEIILLVAGILIFIYADHLYYEDKNEENQI